MQTQSTDAHPEVERVLISLIRKLSREEKLNQTLKFSSSIINLSKRAIARANPELNDAERNILFVQYHYGQELANKLRNYLKNILKKDYFSKINFLVIS
ncbi:MAG: hypothetical protein DAHOPDDO_03244 [Ignavibacteriaceae bacterium]|nr:hypothetical protein [Ignavibacteriaceae bacterium]